MRRSVRMAQRKDIVADLPAHLALWLLDDGPYWAPIVSTGLMVAPDRESAIASFTALNG
jgi:hypothetical protein